MRESGREADVPMVGIVVVNYFGGDMTIRCLESLDRLTWPRSRLAVSLVDNGSEPGFLEDLRNRWPDTRVVVTGANLGFGGGCNRGFDALRDCKYIALLNNDAIPDPGWLEPLVEALTTDDRCAAATPKVLLDGQFIRVDITSPTVRPGGGDPRLLGVQLCGARVGEVDVSRGVELVSGFWGWEQDITTIGGTFAWTSGSAVALLPVPPERVATDDISLRLACGTGAAVVEVSVGTGQKTVAVEVQPRWVTVGHASIATSLVNNAGMVLRPDGSAADRGYLEADDGRYDQPEEVFGWSGAAVLLTRQYLDDVGTFTERLFLYYEDVELSWRGRLRGWTYRYEPTSRAHHVHSASVDARAPTTRHLALRNRLLTSTRCAPGSMAVAAVADICGELATAVVRDVVFRSMRHRRPVATHATALGRILLGYLRHLPPTILARRRDATAPTVRTAVVARWAK